MGIILGPGLTINASLTENQVIENAFGQKEDEKSKSKIFRYVPNSEDIEEQVKEENLSSKKKKKNTFSNFK